jgi:hypothetical protein
LQTQWASIGNLRLFGEDMPRTRTRVLRFPQDECSRAVWNFDVLPGISWTVGYWLRVSRLRVSRYGGVRQSKSVCSGDSEWLDSQTKLLPRFITTTLRHSKFRALPLALFSCFSVSRIMGIDQD